MLRDNFGLFGKGSKTAFREVLRLSGEFVHSFMDEGEFLRRFRARRPPANGDRQHTQA